MPIICPTITASGAEEYRLQIELVSHFAHRIQIDLTDGHFAPKKLVQPDQVWWPVGIKADIHLMYKNPTTVVKEISGHGPNLVIVHAESVGNFEEFVGQCHAHRIKVGVALLPQTQASIVLPALHHIDHVLIFSGNLGYQGGSRADLTLLDKVRFLKEHKRNLEIGWDGGINDQNIAKLAQGGVDVLNVGGFIQKSEDPERAFKNLQRIADESG